MTYAIIPARGGSKGVPGKNIRQLAGHPLIAYTIRAALLSKSIERTLVSTDSPEIAEIARSYGAEVPFYRPAVLAGDRSTDHEFVAHALEWFHENEGRRPELLVHLRPTTPLRDPGLIDAAVAAIRADGQATALRSVHEMSESAYKAFEIDGGRLKQVGTGSFELDAANEARQKLPKTFQPNGYVDVLKTAFVLDHGRIHGGKVAAYLTPRVVEVDTPDDFELLELMIGKNRELFEALFN